MVSVNVGPRQVSWEPLCIGLFKRLCSGFEPLGGNSRERLKGGPVEGGGHIEWEGLPLHRWDTKHSCFEGAREDAEGSPCVGVHPRQGGRPDGRV